MRGFRDPKRTQQFLSCFGPIRQHFALKRHLLRASLYRKQLAAERIAWLETDASMQPHGLPTVPVVALAPELRPAGVDAVPWAQVTAPAQRAHSDGSVELIAWFLPSTARLPERWTVIARPGVPATIERIAASDLPVS